jgi:hypothetical protein
MTTGGEPAYMTRLGEMGKMGRRPSLDVIVMVAYWELLGVVDAVVYLMLRASIVIGMARNVWWLLRMAYLTCMAG